jgi:hypothetical protein
MKLKLECHIVAGHLNHDDYLSVGDKCQKVAKLHI